MRVEEIWRKKEGKRREVEERERKGFQAARGFKGMG